MVQPISSDYSVSGQITPEELQQAAQEGFKSVLNLRSPNENGFMSEEQQMAESLGMDYANVPLTVASANADRLDAIVAELEQLPKPTLIHCAVGMRASAIALLSVAKREGLTLEQALDRAKAAGYDFDTNPQLKQLFEEAIG